MDVSIIICCYNSAKRIVTTLEYLAKLSLDDLKVELILVDNNCSDNTVSVAENEWSKLNSPFPLRVIREETPGLSNARKSGIFKSLGNTLIFCDDDNWLSYNYVVVSHQLLMTKKEVGILCGKSLPVSDVDFPDWFTSYQLNYAVGVHSLESSDISSKGWLWGAGMALRKRDIVKMYNSGFQNFALDRTGKSLSTGGDVEICKWYLICGFRLWFEEDIFLYHFIPKERLNKNYISTLINMNNDASFIYAHYDVFLQFDTIKKVVRYIILNGISFLYNLIFSSLSINDKFILYKLSLKQLPISKPNIFKSVDKARNKFVKSKSD